jgi:hypothetical protein
VLRLENQIHPAHHHPSLYDLFLSEFSKDGNTFALFTETVAYWKAMRKDRTRKSLLRKLLFVEAFPFCTWIPQHFGFDRFRPVPDDGNSATYVADLIARVRAELITEGRRQKVSCCPVGHSSVYS